MVALVNRTLRTTQVSQGRHSQRSPADGCDRIDWRAGPAKIIPIAYLEERRARARVKLPLESVRVVDMGWVWAGALPGHILADMGAEVIKVESRTHLDVMRRGRPIVGDVPDPEQQPMFHNTNRNKLSVTINCQDPRGIELVKGLVRISDVFLENMRVGAVEGMGLGYEDLRALKPDIVYISLPGMGRTGPLSHLVTYGPVLTAMSGFDSMVGYEDGKVLGLQHGLADPNGGLFAALAVLVALWHHQRTGEGQFIDLSQMESVSILLGEAIMDYVMNGRVMKPQGNRSSRMAPHGIYPCQGEDKWVSVAVESEEEWRGLLRAMGEPQWAQDPRFADRYQRLSHQEELDVHVAEWTRQYTHEEVTTILQREGVAAAPLLDVSERLVHPLYEARGANVWIDHPILGGEVIYGIPWRMSDTPGEIRRRAPLMGEHNEYVLGDLLGLSRGQIEELEREGVLQ